MKISIILPTYNREALLCQTITEVLKQQYSDFELIVLDQSPSHEEETEIFLKRHQNDIHYYHLTKPGVVGACNRGIECAEGEILLFIDDDISIPHNKLLLYHARNFCDPEVGGIAGKILDAATLAEEPYNPDSLNWRWGYFSTTWNHNVRTEVVTAPGANMSFRKSILLKINGFDENFGGNAFRFETDLCYRVKKAGYKTIFDPDAIVLHHYNSPGGNDNANLFGKSPASHMWYYHFFKNNFYFFLKDIGGINFFNLVWRLYRGHVFNRPYVKVGPTFQIARHQVFARGLADAIRLYRGFRAKNHPQVSSI